MSRLILKRKRINSIFLLFLLLLSTTIFSIPVNNVKLYRIATHPDYEELHVETDFDFTHTMRLSTTAKVLSGNPNNLKNGDKICPVGADEVVSISSTIGGKWAAPDFYAKISTAPGYEFSCDLDKIQYHYDTTNHNLPIFWHKENYNELIDEELCWWDESCWGKEGLLTKQSVNYLGADKLYRGREGRVNIVCKGRLIATVTKEGGSRNYMSTKLTEGGDTFYGDKTLVFAVGDNHKLDEIGNHTFATYFNIGGCAAVIRYPTCENYYDVEQILGRTEPYADNSAPEFTWKDNKKITIQVVDPKAAISFVEMQPSQIVLNQDQSSYYIIITVKNTGDVAVRVTGVEASNSCFIAIPACGVIGNCGFDVSFNPGTEQNVAILLTKHPLCSSPPASTTLSFTYVADEKTCAPEQPETHNLDVEVNTVPYDISGILIPEYVEINQYDTPSFSLTCYNSTTGKPLPACPPGVKWDIYNLNYKWVEKNDMGATVNITSAPPAVGTINATVFSNGVKLFTVGSIINVISKEPPNGGEEGEPVNCTLSPEFLSLRTSQTGYIEISCTDAKGKETACPNIVWSVTNEKALADGKLSETSDMGAIVKASEHAGESTMIIAEGRHDGKTFDCSAMVNVTRPTCEDVL